MRIHVSSVQDTTPWDLVIRLFITFSFASFKEQSGCVWHLPNFRMLYNSYFGVKSKTYQVSLMAVSGFLVKKRLIMPELPEGGAEASNAAPNKFVFCNSLLVMYLHQLIQLWTSRILVHMRPINSYCLHRIIMIWRYFRLSCDKSMHRDCSHYGMHQSALLGRYDRKIGRILHVSYETCRISMSEQASRNISSVSSCTTHDPILLYQFSDHTLSPAACVRITWSCWKGLQTAYSPVLTNI